LEQDYSDAVKTPCSQNAYDIAQNNIHNGLVDSSILKKVKCIKGERRKGRKTTKNSNNEKYSEKFSVLGEWSNEQGGYESNQCTAYDIDKKGTEWKFGWR
jgi:hypothetical protein